MIHVSQNEGKGCRVLVADDNLDGAESWARLLELQGYQCRIAGNGEETLLLFTEFSPEVIIMDIAMPALDGNEVARKIREVNTEVTLIAISGWARDVDREHCFAAGFDYYLPKPAEPEYLMELLAIQ